MSARVACFGFGSNSVRQLRGRLGDQTLAGYPARIHNQGLAFGGPNKSWAHDEDSQVCGTATLVPLDGEVALGTLCYLTDAQMETLDGFEGVPFVYNRAKFDGEVLQGGEWIKLPVVAYIRQKNDWYPPSEAYRCAVLRNLRGSFPQLHTLVIRDCNGEVRSSWQHPGFAQLGLGAFLFELGVRRQEPWMLPSRIGQVKARLQADHGIEGRAEALRNMLDTGALSSLPLEDDELHIVQQLLVKVGAGHDLQDDLHEDDAQVERALMAFPA